MLASPNHSGEVRNDFMVCFGSLNIIYLRLPFQKDAWQSVIILSIEASLIDCYISTQEALNTLI